MAWLPNLVAGLHRLRAATTVADAAGQAVDTESVSCRGLDKGPSNTDEVIRTPDMVRKFLCDQGRVLIS